jgi:3-oxoacid CoA-transferase subunit A
MPPQIYPTPFDALFDVFDGAVILVGGFGHVGHPHNLVRALRDRGVKNLTIVANNIGLGDSLDLLAETGQIKKFIGSFPVRASRERMTHFERLFREGLAEVEITPQGTMVERIRAAGAGIAAFYTPVGVGTIVEQGKEKRVFNGREYVLELALPGDFALIKAYKADKLGNLVYRRTARNFNPIMATAAKITIAEVEEVVEPGELDPEAIVTPGIYVDRLVICPRDYNDPAIFQTWD